jgi:uncharacterized protein (TIGR02147 family)
MSGAQKELNLYVYRDYRRFLRDWYTQTKKAHRSFSFRAFSKRAGFKSPNFFKLVMDGERNLTEESLAKFVTGLRLNKPEQEFFRNLVFFTQAKSHDEKNLFYRRLLQSSEFSQLKTLEQDQYEFYSTWYHPVIREMVTSSEFDGTPEWLARKLHPPILPEQAKKSIELLEKLGMIKRTGPARWEQTSPLLTTGPEVQSLTLMNYHQNLLGLAREVLPLIPAPQRDISALTLGISGDKIPMLKKKIQAFRQEILKYVSLEKQPDTVILLNIQMLPVTQTKGKTS